MSGRTMTQLARAFGLLVYAALLGTAFAFGTWLTDDSPSIPHLGIAFVVGLLYGHFLGLHPASYGQTKKHQPPSCLTERGWG